MHNNGEMPWSFSNRKNAELQRYVADQRKRIAFLEKIRPWVKTGACVAVFILIGLIWDGIIEPEGAGSRFATAGESTKYSFITIAISFTIVLLLVSSWFRNTIAQINGNIQNEESRTEKAIASYQTEYDRQAAVEASRIEAERKQREAIAEAERRKKEEEDNARMREWEKAFREKIQREELAADERMSQSELVHEIAQCILPTFKQIVEKVDTEAHMKVRVRLSLEVRADTIDYYDAADPQNRSRFDFKEEGIAEKLSPILRKALCKALVTELRLLILEAFPIDPERKMVQADLEGPVVLKSNVTYVPGREYTAPEYDANSHAYAVILYQASKDKGPRHF